MVWKPCISRAPTYSELLQSDISAFSWIYAMPHQIKTVRDFFMSQITRKMQQGEWPGMAQNFPYSEHLLDSGSAFFLIVNPIKHIICGWACWGFAHQLEEQLLCHTCKVANKIQTNSFVEEKLQNVLVSTELRTSIDQLVWSHLANVVGSLSSVSKLKCPPEQCYIFGIKSRLVIAC
ncbi:hypothetical protein ACLB2K_076906 [Fragaria x ananassa]